MLLLLKLLAILAGGLAVIFVLFVLMVVGFALFYTMRHLIRVTNDYPQY